MNKTASQVQGDILRMLQGSALAGMLSGAVYRAGLRPRGSRLEDAVISFTAGLPGQIQSGVVTVNIFIPDVETTDTGVMVADGDRCEELEYASQRWVDSLTADKSEYLFELAETIYTEAARDMAQHFVVVRLNYRRLTI